MLNRKYFIYLLLAVLFFVVLRFLFEKSIWDGSRRVSMVVNGEQGVSLIVFDPHDFLITKINIPSETMLGTSYGMGDWPVRSVWKLGYQEDYGGEFLRTSVMKTFRLPVDLWAEDEASNFGSSGLFSVLGAVLGNYRSNMNLKDRMLLGFFSLRVNSGSRVSVDMADLGFLEKTKVGGDEAFLVRETVPDKLLSLFVLRDFLDRNVLISVIDNSSSGVSESRLIGIMEHMGGKVVSFEEGEKDNDLDCVVSSGDRLVLKEFSRLFSCKAVLSDDGETIEFRFGEKFAHRW